MSKLKVGQIYEVINSHCGNFDRDRERWGARFVKVVQVSESGDMMSEYEHLDGAFKKVGECYLCFSKNHVEDGSIVLLTQSATKPIHIMSSLIEKAKLAFKSEPEKSFIKVGVMDSNENLTNDGKELLLSYLLEKNKEDFKKVVVDPILEEVKD